MALGQNRLGPDAEVPRAPRYGHGEVVTVGLKGQIEVGGREPRPGTACGSRETRALTQGLEQHGEVRLLGDLADQPR